MRKVLFCRHAQNVMDGQEVETKSWNLCLNFLKVGLLAEDELVTMICGLPVQAVVNDLKILKLIYSTFTDLLIESCMLLLLHDAGLNSSTLHHQIKT